MLRKSALSLRFPHLLKYQVPPPPPPRGGQLLARQLLYHCQRLWDVMPGRDLNPQSHAPEADLCSIDSATGIETGLGLNVFGLDMRCLNFFGLEMRGYILELERDKTNKMTCAPRED